MLTKLPARTFVPGTPGNPGRPEQTVCTPASGGATGSWVTKCTTINVFIGWNNGPATWDNPGPFPKAVYIPQTTCRTEWVPAPGRPAPPPAPVCTTYPAVPAVQAIPPRVEVTPIFDWNAGANSADEIEGDARVVFTMLQCVAAIVGFTTDREAVGSPDRMSHAFVFTTSPTGQALAQVREGAQVRTAALPYVPDETEFQIRRIGNAVTYLRDGAILYTSRAPIDAGMLSVGCSVYATGDRVPSNGAAPPPPAECVPVEFGWVGFGSTIMFLPNPAVPSWWESLPIGATATIVYAAGNVTFYVEKYQAGAQGMRMLSAPPNAYDDFPFNTPVDCILTVDSSGFTACLTMTWAGAWA